MIYNLLAVRHVSQKAASYCRSIKNISYLLRVILPYFILSCIFKACPQLVRLCSLSLGSLLMHSALNSSDFCVIQIPLDDYDFLLVLSVYQASSKSALESIIVGLFLIHRRNAFTYIWIFAFYRLF